MEMGEIDIKVAFKYSKEEDVYERWGLVLYFSKGLN